MADLLPFSTVLRERSGNAHAGSEHAGFMADLIQGRGTRDDYIALTAQHWFIYQAIEHAAETMKDDPVASVFVTDRLTRLPAIEADLEFLVGPGWRDRIAPLPTTIEYGERIREVGRDWPGGFIAHHYTRYLGDLSGGQFISRLMQRRFGFETNGVSFYLFAEIADPRAFKETYRAQLDAAPWDADEQARVIDEVLRAYRFNTALFEDLSAAKLAA
ncbi:heme oxygenase [Microbacterium mangrovi]|uniref:Heme oxygenase n=1 Tax=Microbacterium mangrovi TaxID=1348253 RepID=A0A0B2AEA2_9MICO|nr:biliverdin-producing heme oxygenase [Microbacterium mangrovi]KHK99976.1 heme oxygenase [Microbacterium mangrovi]